MVSRPLSLMRLCGIPAGCRRPDLLDRSISGRASGPFDRIDPFSVVAYRGVLLGTTHKTSHMKLGFGAETKHLND